MNEYCFYRKLSKIQLHLTAISVKNWMWYVLTCVKLAGILICKHSRAQPHRIVILLYPVSSFAVNELTADFNVSPVEFSIAAIM